MNEKNVLYNGHVVSVKPLTKSKVPKVIVFYWKSDEDEEDGENVTMTVYGLLADYIAGDLNLSVLNTCMNNVALYIVLCCYNGIFVLHCVLLYY